VPTAKRKTAKMTTMDRLAVYDVLTATYRANGMDEKSARENALRAAQTMTPAKLSKVLG
jgi:hypothetical protein